MSMKLLKSLPYVLRLQLTDAANSTYGGPAQLAGTLRPTASAAARTLAKTVTIGSCCSCAPDCKLLLAVQLSWIRQAVQEAGQAYCAAIFKVVDKVIGMLLLLVQPVQHETHVSRLTLLIDHCVILCNCSIYRHAGVCFCDHTVAAYDMQKRQRFADVSKSVGLV